jgi:hypothetical protein
MAGNALASAQQMDQAPPKVLQVTREFIKPGKGGAAHDRTESAYVQAMARSKEPIHYVAMNSMSGKSRALYLAGYDSFEAIQKDNDAMNKNAALGAELDRDTVADGQLLDGVDQFLFAYDPDTSYRPSGDLTTARYMEFTDFYIKPGHMSEFNELAKMVIDANKKAGTSAHWVTYDIAYGGDNMVVVLSADKSMADIDKGFAENKSFETAMGESGMKKLHELEAASIDKSDSELFSINPKQSYPLEEWVKGNPEFWKPKPMMASAAKAASPAPATKTTP